MATINNFKITSVNKNQVNFFYNYEEDTWDVKTYGGTFRDESSYGWTFSTTGGSSSSSPCNYTPSGEGALTYTLKAILSYYYNEGYYDWERDSYKKYYDQLRVPNNNSGGTWKVEYVVDYWWIDEAGVRYYDYTEYYYTLKKIYQANNKLEQKEMSVTFYPHPAEFTFTGCTSGARWKIDDGLDSLITNIEEFQPRAQQWKSWKNQSAAGTCPSFANSEGYLAASSMNSVYNYVGKGTPWKVGDEISAAMFNDLATAINS